LRTSVGMWGLDSMSFRLMLALSIFSSLNLAPVYAAPYGGDELSGVRTSDEKKLNDLRIREINEIRTVLGRRLEKNRKVDLYIRLAEAYLDQYRAEFLTEGKAHEKRLAEGRQDPLIDRTHSRPYLREGIKACEEVIRSGVEHPKLDQIYYFLGVNYDELEDGERAIQAFRTLAQKYPKSPYTGEAYRALAENAYSKNKFRDALSYYNSAARGYQGAAYPRLLQKMAWTHYRLRQYDQAIDVMKQSVSAAQTNERFLSLKEEALRDLGLFYMEKGNVDDAVAYFRTVSGDKDYFPKVLERLGAQYERNADRDKAIQVYELLLKTHPRDEAGFRVRAKMIELDINQKAFAKAIARYAEVTVPKTGEEETLQAARELKAVTRSGQTATKSKTRLMLFSKTICIM
ncbi:MAG: tetratricopeptide repeat protein, partial [Proteobacteria bacterium]